MGMIIDRKLPKDGGRRAIGYWRSDAEPHLPDPREYVDATWDPLERDRVIAYLKAAPVLHSWRGPSHCRLGCPGYNGTRCLGDDAFIWPEGFAHYLEKHGVRPPAEFVEHALARREDAARPWGQGPHLIDPNHPSQRRRD